MAMLDDDELQQSKSLSVEEMTIPLTLDIRSKNEGEDADVRGFCLAAFLVTDEGDYMLI